MFLNKQEKYWYNGGNRTKIIKNQGEKPNTRKGVKKVKSDGTPPVGKILANIGIKTWKEKKFHLKKESEHVENMSNVAKKNLKQSSVKETSYMFQKKKWRQGGVGKKKRLSLE